MAGELRTSLNTFRFVKDAVDISIPAVLANFDVAGTNYIRRTQVIGTGDETLDLGEVATNGYIFLWNHDGTHFITMGADGSSYPIKLKSNEWAVLRWNGAAIHAKADTAACQLEYLLIED